jgi:GAF domain-containing protein
MFLSLLAFQQSESSPLIWVLLLLVISLLSLAAALFIFYKIKKEKKRPQESGGENSDELKTRDAELKIISSIVESISMQMDLNGIIKVVGDNVRDIFSAEATEILLINEKNNLIEVPYSFYKKYHHVEPFELGGGLTSKVIESRAPLLLNTLQEQDELGSLADESIGEDDITESYMGVPIIVANKVFGVVSVQSYKQSAYDDKSVRLLSTISANMGIALENARLFEETNKLLDETRQRNSELGVINTIQEGLVAQMDIQGIYDLVGDQIRNIFDAQVLSIASYDHGNKLCHFKYDIEKGNRFYDEPRKFNAIDNYLIKNRQILLIKEDLLGALAQIGGKNITPAEGTEMAKSALWVPLIVGEKVIGHVSLQNIDKENAFSESDIRLLTTLANSMSVALENARLFDATNKLLDETRQRNSELGVINTIQEGLVAQMDIQAIYDLVGDQIRNIFDAQVLSIGSYEHENKMCHFKYDIEKGNRFYDEPRKFNAIDNYLIKNRQILLIKEDMLGGLAAIGEENANPAEGTEMPKSALWVPLIVGEKVIGYVSLQNVDKENAFSESDIRLLTTLANSMSVALENARLFDETTHLLEETKQQAIELKIINSVGEGLAQKLDYQSIVDLVGNKIQEFFNAQIVTISTYDPQDDTIFHRYAIENGERFYFDKPHSIDPDRKEIITTRKALVFNTSQEIIDHSGEGILAGEMPKSYMGVPLIRNQEATGVITVQDADKEYLYGEKDLRLLMTLAANMGVALENARLFEETNRLLNETQQRNAELSILNAIQQGLVMEMDFTGIIELVGDKLREALGFMDIGIRLYDKHTNLLHFPYEFEHGKRLYIDPIPPTAISDYVLSNKKMLLLKKNNEEELIKLGLKGMMVIPGTDWSKSLVCVPITLGEEARGLIMIENYEKEDAFSDSEIRLLTTLANSMSVALENARLFNETQQRNAELSILNAIQQGLVMEMDFQGIINLVGDKLREALSFLDIGIRIYEKEKDLIHFPYEFEHGKRLTLESAKLFGVSKYVIKNKKMLLVEKNDDNSLKNLGVEETEEIPGTDRSKSLIAVPIMLGEEARGLIIIENYEKEEAFKESDVRLLTTLSNSMSMALENARLFNETSHLLVQTRQRAAELSTVNSISQALAAHLELDKLINLVGEKMRELFNANIVYVALYDKETKIINFPYGYGDDFPPMTLGEGLTSQIIKSGKPLLMNKKVGEKTAELGIERIGIPSSSYLGVPIPVGNEIIGVISVQSTEKENRFSDEDLRLLITIATNVGFALNNAEAYRQLNQTVEQLNATLNDLKATQKQLIVQEKLASLGQLTAGIAHEIKNPLNFVNNFAEVSTELITELREEILKVKAIKEDDNTLQNITDLLKDLEDNSNRINQHGKRADSIVKSMLQHSRGKAGERQVSDINAMLEEDINLAYHGMRARDNTFNVTIEKDFNKDLEKLSVIPQDISRVFLNIINNGFYEANKKKKTSNNNFSPTLKVSTHDFKNRIEVHIRDNGNGIPADIRDKLFNPFFTTKPTGEGTGLGLSLSHDIVVKQHEGNIRFETESGKYTEFIISLPKNGFRLENDN